MAIEKTRASRDGHQFHEAWLARRALGLVLARDELCAIAVEGLSQEDEEFAPDAAVEIADAVFYWGDGGSFESCRSVEIAQFKYSIGASEVPVRMADAKKTIEKFAKTEADFLSRFGSEQVAAKLLYSFNTNRPISPGLVEALNAAVKGAGPESEDGRSQLDQLRTASGLSGEALQVFASRLMVVGLMGQLRDLERGNARILADWSSSDDMMARARLGDLRQLVRDKAGSAGARDKLIRRVDVLAALDLSHETDLLPSEQAFPSVGVVVERAQVANFAERLFDSPLWLVHATGGVGKTVFMQSLAVDLQTRNEVVLFDCFGGGGYRMVTDGRHRPDRGFLHIINELACRGLCDPILPGVTDPSAVLRRGLQRIRQVIDTMRRTQPDRRLVVLIDAADNAGMEADRRGQLSFPRELFVTLANEHSIEGLHVVLTARPEREEKAIGNAQCARFPLLAFTPAESAEFILARRPDASAAQIEALHYRAGGVPRVISNLIEPDRDLDGETKPASTVSLDNLIQERIDRAVRLAAQKGADDDAIRSFLCALSALPPPVPIDDIALAFGVTAAEVESFASDLSPLLDRSRHGLIFRDEPTETLVEQRYGSQVHLLEEVAKRLTAAQSSSVYAARTLPGLLFAMGQVEELRNLAFDTRFPTGSDSEVAKRRIRLNRLRMALAAAAQKNHYDSMVEMLVELSAVTAMDERGQDFLLDHPDLVVSLGDAEALRRLFDAKGDWPGARHSRLATAYAADGDTSEAYAQAKRADEWHRWYWQQRDESRPRLQASHEDFVGIAAYLVAQNRLADVARYLDSWTPTFGYKLASRLFEICKVSNAMGKLDALPGLLNRVAPCRRLPLAAAAALLRAYPELDDSISKHILRRMAKALSKNAKPEKESFNYEQIGAYRLGMQYCAMRAVALGLDSEALVIDQAARSSRFRLWELRDPFSTRYVLPWVLSVAVRAVAESRQPTLFDCLPSELWGCVSEMAAAATEEAQREQVEACLRQQPSKSVSSDGKEPEVTLSESDRQCARQWLKPRIVPLVGLATQLATLLSAEGDIEREAGITSYFDRWVEAVQAAQEGVGSRSETLWYLDGLYGSAALEIFAASNTLTKAAGEALLIWLQRAPFAPVDLCIRFVSRFASRDETGAVAGRIAAHALTRIETEDDVALRSRYMAKLARAMVRANRTEAAALFTRALSELDAIGSGDHALTNELLAFSRSLSVSPLRAESAHRLAKICELNMYESRKFPWPLMGAAFSRVWGVPYLAQLARWHDRGKAELELTLAPALSAFVRDRLIPPREALCLLRLVVPSVSWDWGWEDMVRSVITADLRNAPTLVEEVLRQFELSYPERPSKYHLEKIRVAVAEVPEILSAVRASLERLEMRANQPRTVERSSTSSVGKIDQDALRRREEEEEEKAKAIVAAVSLADPLNVSSIEALATAINHVSGALDAKTRAFERLREKVPYSQQAIHIEAIVSARNLELREKTQILNDIRSAWLDASPSGLSMLKGVGSNLIQMHAEELLDRDWGISTDLTDLSKLSGQTKETLALELIRVSAVRELDVPATIWLYLASLLAPSASPDVPKQALERLMSSGAARLADEVGDGVWHPALQPGPNAIESFADLVWFCLGSPQAVERWRAAHAVLMFARLGCWAVIDAMFIRFDNPGAGAFHDPRLPFFAMHARQWFLLAVARIAIDQPSEVARHSAKLEAISFDEEFPHVGLREAARRALLACIKADDSTAAAELRRRLEGIHSSPFEPNQTASQHSGEFDWKRPAGVPEPHPSFYFDYDYDKSDLKYVARLFDLPSWRLRDGCVDWIRKWDVNVTHMSDMGGRERPGGYSQYWRDDDERFNSYGAYLARHALALESGRLFLSTPLHRSEYSYSTWDEWVSRFRPTHSDGLWLSDGTDRHPDFSLNDLKADLPGLEQPVDDGIFLASLANIEPDGRVGESLVVDASWSSNDGVRARISSVLVPVGFGELAARAVATAPRFHMWLPTFEHDEDLDEFHSYRFRDMKPLEPWVTMTNAELRIDLHDPNGCRDAVQRPRPAKVVIDVFGLQTSSPWAADWCEQEGALAFNALAWGQREGQGDHETVRSGSSLTCQREFLSRLLTAMDRDLLLLIKLEHYREKRNSKEKDGAEDGFSHSNMVLLVQRDLVARFVNPAPGDIEAVQSLATHHQCDFDRRLGVLRRQ